ncbi:MAG: phosphoribosyltransferase [Chloroflexi bacterium]|nr:phosphoribosyltransferase [Chloroflexota bacterium]
MIDYVSQDRPLYKDRQDAGRKLAGKLAGYCGNCVVFAIPNGGIPVAAEVARELGAALDVVVVRKLNIPFNPEAGFGAVTTEGTPVYNKPLMKRLGLTDREVLKQAEGVRGDIDKRNALFRGDRPFPWLVGKVAIVIDDGLASGYTMAAAIKSIRNHRAGKVVAAAPVGSESGYQIVKTMADDVVCPAVSKGAWFAVASFYENWYDLSDEEALSVLDKFRQDRQAEASATPGR